MRRRVSWLRTCGCLSRTSRSRRSRRDCATGRPGGSVGIGVAASATLTLIAAIVMAAGSFGLPSVRDRAARLTSTEQTAGASLNAARAAIEAGDLVLAGHHVAEARGHLGNDGGSLPGVAANIDRVQTDIDTRQGDIARFQRFAKLAADCAGSQRLRWGIWR